MSSSDGYLIPSQADAPQVDQLEDGKGTISYYWSFVKDLCIDLHASLTKNVA